MSIIAFYLGSYHLCTMKLLRTQYFYRKIMFLFNSFYIKYFVNF